MNHCLHIYANQRYTTLGGECVGEWEQADLHYVDHLLNADVLRACNPYSEQRPVKKAPRRL